jgi:hypothetical protein
VGPRLAPAAAGAVGVPAVVALQHCEPPFTPSPDFSPGHITPKASLVFPATLLHVRPVAHAHCSRRFAADAALGCLSPRRQ